MRGLINFLLYRPLFTSLFRADAIINFAGGDATGVRESLGMLDIGLIYSYLQQL